MKLIFFRCLVMVTLAIWGERASAEIAIPRFQGNVLDEAGLLSPGEVRGLLADIQRLRERSNVWAAIYIRPDLLGTSLEEVANLTFERWRLGKAGVDNGLLILVVPGERQMRIEVGYGLEGHLTDYYSHRLITRVLRPAFREGAYARGLGQALLDIEGHMATFEPLPSGPFRPYIVLWRNHGFFWVFPWLFTCGFLLLATVLRLALRKADPAKEYQKKLGRAQATILVLGFIQAVVHYLNWWDTPFDLSSIDAWLPVLFLGAPSGLLIAMALGWNPPRTGGGSGGVGGSSGSGSSGGGSSSSSGGGRSGGGGASGSW